MLFRYIILCFFSVQPLSAQQSLNTYLESAGKTAQISVIIQDLHGKILYEQNSQNKIPSASVIKIPILFTLFSQVEEGKIQLDEQHQLTHDDIA